MQLYQLSKLTNEEVAGLYHSCRNNKVKKSQCITAIGNIIYGPVICGICYAISVYILIHLSHDTHMILHTRAVQSLCNIFVGNPTLLIHCDSMKLLPELLNPNNSNYSCNMHEKLLLSLKRMLDAEEVNNVFI